MMRTHLDLASVEAFVIVADFRSFTRAARLMNLTQAGISQKIRRLEEALDRALLVRTPRQVRLTAEGERFLDRARELLSVEEMVFRPSTQVRRRLSLGLSDHLMGPNLPDLLSDMRVQDPLLDIQVRVDRSEYLANQFASGTIDCIFILRHGHRIKTEVLLEDPFGWLGASGKRVNERPISLVTLAEECGVRAAAIHCLKRTKLDWVDAFVGGGVATVLEAVRRGLGVAPLPLRYAQDGIVDLSGQLGLCPLPHGEVAMMCRPLEAKTLETVRVISTSIKNALSSDVDLPRCFEPEIIDILLEKGRKMD